MITLSPASMLDLKHLLIAHLINDGENEVDATDIAILLCEDLASGIITDTLLWDALGVDDEGYMEKNPELKSLYEYLTETFKSAPYATKH